MFAALEKFTAVRDEGDGSAFKVDGVRGTKKVGAAGDFRGSQQVDITERDTDIDGGRFRVNGLNPAADAGSLVVSTSSPNLIGAAIAPSNDERTVREALRFFFGREGEVFRDFMLEEVVTVVDASSRETIRELARTLGLSNVPVPSFVRALSPELNENDKRVRFARTLHAGMVKKFTVPHDSYSVFLKQMVQQIQKLVQFLLGDFEESASTDRLRKLIPVIREFAPELRRFGTLLVARLTEKTISRGLNWATARMQRV